MRIRVRGIHSLFFLFCLVVGCPAQNPTLPDIGLRPFGPYFDSDIYHVNLQTGNVYGQIPIVSIPQKGKLPPLSFSLNFNTSPFIQQEVCNSAFDTCIWYYDYQPIQVAKAAGVQLLTSYNAWEPQFSTISSAGYFNCYDLGEGDTCSIAGFLIQQWNISDITGSSHQMLYDSTNTHRLYATDGSGYSLVLPASFDPANPLSCLGCGTVYSPDGIAYHSGTVTDPYGNAVQRIGPQNATVGPQIIDSLGHIFPDVEYGRQNNVGPIIGQTGDVTNCPNLGVPNQQPLYSIQLSFPGPNGNSTQYLLCYTQIVAHTGFYNFDPSMPDSLADPSTDTNGFINTITNFTAIQSVVLPNEQGTSLATNPYWGFIYDAANTTQSNGNSYSSESYGTLNKIIYPTGASATFSYVNTNVLPADPRTRPAYRSVQQIVKNDGLGNLSSTTYTYGPETVDAGGVHTYRTFGPPIWTNVTDSLGNVTKHNLESISSSAECLQSGFYYETQTSYYQGAASGSPLKTVNTQYDVNSQNVDCAYVISNFTAVVPKTITTYVNNTVESTITNQYPTLFTASAYWCALIAEGCTTVPPTGMPVPYAVPYQTAIEDGSGNILQTKSSPPSFTTDLGKKNANMLTLPASTQVLDGGGNQVALNTYGYDQFGNQTAVSRWLNTTGQYETTSTTYNADGKPNLITDANNNKTSIPAYQCSGIFPQTVIAAYQSPSTISETTSYVYDCDTGDITSVTDPNGIVTQYFHDPLGRLTYIKRAIGTSVENWTTATYPSMTQMAIAQDKDLSTDGVLRSTNIYDGLGRIIHQTDTAGSTVDTSYSALGNVNSVSNPYRAIPAAGDPPLGTTYYTYDALGRTTKITNPDNTAIYNCYDGVATNGQPNCSSNHSSMVAASWVDSTDEVGHHTQRVTDPLGQLTAVVEPNPLNGSIALETDYSYNALTNLTDIRQVGSGGEVVRYRNFRYDSLARLTASCNPEALPPGYSCAAPGGAPALWSNTYGYDANGNLKRKTDSRNVTSHYGYDSLNRLTDKTFSGIDAASNAIAMATPSTCYQYDTGQSNPSGGNFLGRLTYEWTTSGACGPFTSPTGYKTLRTILAYDPLGRVKSEQQCHLAKCMAGVPYNSITDYDLAGNLTAYTNGVHSIMFANHYDATGRLQNLDSSWADSTHPATLFTGNSYAPAGAITSMTLGTAIKVTRAYDNRLRPTAESAIHP